MTQFYLTSKTIKDAKPIAINTEDGTVIKLTEQKDDTLKLDDPLDHINEKDMRLNKKYMSALNINKLRTALIKNEEPEGELKELYNVLKEKLKNKLNNEIKIFDGEFMLLPTPKKANRIYIAGSTGVGKSTWIKNYIIQLHKIYPNRVIYLFSDVENDPQLGSIPHITQIKLNMNLVTKPIQTMELADSVCIFDDIDSISNKKIKKAIYDLYDAILKKGSSKDNIELIISNHAMSDYRETRNILINCNYVIFFPQSAVGVQYTLKKFGLNNEQMRALMNVPSRWCVLHKNFPFYAITQKSVFLL